MILSSEQAGDMASYFTTMVEEIDNYLGTNIGIDPTQEKDLSQMRDQIALVANNFFQTSNTLDIGDAQASIDQIQAITTQISGNLSTLDDINKIVNIAASVVALAQACTTADPESIAKAIGNSIMTVNSTFGN